MSEPSEEAVALAAEAYVYGYPLVFDLSEVTRFTAKGLGSLAAAPLNTFSHATKLAGPEDTFVSVNNDTLYSIGHVDLSAGPVRLSVPDTAGAYYVLQFVDVWTNNIAYIGRRATGTAAAEYLLTPPGWTKEVPDGVVPVRMSTDIVSIVGRFACDGPDDLPRVRALQEQLTLKPTAWLGNGLPEVPTEGLSDEEAFYERLWAWMAAFPPSEVDQTYQKRFEPLKRQPGTWKEGMAEGQRRIEEGSRAGQAPPVNGWSLAPHLFDYNVDHLGLGTLDSPEWKIADRKQAYLTRAISARVGLWGNHGYEAVYAMIYTDDRAEKLTGERSYAIRFEQPPPVDGFWSLTMYDVPDYYLVENPAGRYSIGDRTPGLRTAEDGSLTIVVQRDDPGEQVNWLPAPAGEFRPILRLYQPREEILQGAYALPPMERRD